MHADACPESPQREARARIFAMRSISILDDAASERAHVISAIGMLGRLIRSGCIDEGECVKRVLATAAVQKLHRLDVEQIMDSYLVGPVSR